MRFESRELTAHAFGLSDSEQGKPSGESWNRGSGNGFASETPLPDAASLGLPAQATATFGSTRSEAFVARP